MHWLGSRFSSGLARGHPIMGVRGETLHRVKRSFPGGVGNSLLAIFSTRRPSQDSISANAEQLGAIGPDALQDHSNLSGYSDTRLLRADAPGQPRSPRFEGRPTLHFCEEDIGSLIKAGSGKSIPAFRYPALTIRFSRLIPSRRQPEIGTHIPCPLESVWLIDCGAECKGGHGSDARDRHEPPATSDHRVRNDGFPCPKPLPWQRQPPALRSICRRAPTGPDGL